MNSQYFKDMSKFIKGTSLNQQLPAGSGRRYEPASGLKKHNDRIHRESKIADDHKNLPFTFRKAPKPKGPTSYLCCDNCGHILAGTTATAAIICSECKKFSTVSEVKDE
jgi:hypothetical protein